MESKIISIDAICSAHPSLAMSPEDITACFISPTCENLAVGIYGSKILKIEPAFDEDRPDVICHLDVFHELTDANGNSDVFRFRVFKKFNGLLKWGLKMKEYGFSSVLSEIEGLCETVKIAHGHTYAYISQRKLVSLPLREDEWEFDEEDDDSPTGDNENRRYLISDDEEDDDED